MAVDFLSSIYEMNLPYSVKKHTRILELRKESDEKIANAQLYAKKLGKILNSLHGLHYSEKFWMFLCVPLIMENITRAQDIQNGRIKNGPKSFDDLLRITKSGASFLELLRIWLARIHFLTLKNLLRNNTSFSHNFHYRGNAFKKMKRIKNCYPFFIQSDTKKRNRIIEIARNESDFLFQRILICLPPFLIEEFISLRNSIPIINSEQVVFHISNIHNSFMRLFFAIYQENGATIHKYQHGSHYGDYYNMEAIEKLSADYFHTWGWRIDDKDVIDRAYRLEGFKMVYSQNKEKILYDICLCFAVINYRTKKSQQDISIQLLNGIDRAKFPKIIARPRPFAKFQKADSAISFIDNKKILIDNGKQPIAKLIGKSRLVIHLKLPATTFLECIFVDQPVMGILMKDFIPTNLAIPFYDFFIENGVIHETPESLVKKINSIESILEWWHELMSSDQYKNFKMSFTRSA